MSTDTVRSRHGRFTTGEWRAMSLMVLLLSAGIVAAPIVHRLLHRFHLADSR